MDKKFVILMLVLLLCVTSVILSKIYVATKKQYSVVVLTAYGFGVDEVNKNIRNQIYNWSNKGYQIKELSSTNDNYLNVIAVMEKEIN